MTSAEGRRPAGPLGILIFCRHRLVREGLGLLAGRDGGVRVLAAPASAGGAEELPAVPPDVIVLVDAWDDSGGADEIRRVKADHPAVPVLVLSASVDPAKVHETVAAGAMAFLPLDVDPDDLVRAVRTTARGELSLHRSIVPAYLRYLASDAGATPEAQSHGPSFEDLSPREQEVMDLLARGLGDRDIGQQLFISVRTVQTHLAHIYEKLGVHTRTEAALLAVREGWVS